jgi:hypothetical protein
VNLVDLLFHEMIVIDEPFRCGRNGTTVIDRANGGTIGAEQNGSIIGETRRQKSPLTRPRRHNLRERKTAGVFLEALNAKEFFANGFSVIPRRQTTRAFKGAAQEDFQLDLSAARRRGVRPPARIRETLMRTVVLSSRPHFSKGGKDCRRHEGRLEAVSSRSSRSHEDPPLWAGSDVPHRDLRRPFHGFQPAALRK